MNHKIHHHHLELKVSVAQSLPSSQIIAVPPQQTQIIPTTIPTPEPIRNPTPILPTNAVVVPDSPKNQIFSQVNTTIHAHSHSLATHFLIISSKRKTQK